MYGSKNNSPYEILFRSNNPIINYLNKIDYDDCELRLSSFIVKSKVDEGVLLYSSLTGTVVLVRDFDAARKMLINEHFLLPKNLEEKEFVDATRKVLQKQPYDICTCLDYWIVTTTKCNARCFYCFEKGYEQQTMTLQTAYDTAKFIEKNYSGIPIVLHWYGGEPLLNHQAISKICNSLSQKNIKFISEITTNGYLLDENLQEQALNVWNLLSVIVTLDGTENVYNKIKNYKNTQLDSNPYDRVMKNLSMLIDNDINTIIRTNIGEFNKDDTIELYSFLEKLYLKKK